MSTMGAGWYPDPARRFEMRYWNGSTWTEHVSTRGVQGTDSEWGRWPPGAPVGQYPQLKTGPVGIWVTAVLSAAYFHMWMTINGKTTVIAIPLGLLFVIWCWGLVARARRECEARGIPLPQSYNVARIVAAVLGALNAIVAVVRMTT